MRQWREGRRERKLVLTLSPEWLQAAGIAQGTMQDFLGRHLAHVAWQPSARALAIADQLHRGRTLPAHLQRLWHHSRCLDLVLEALASVDLPRMWFGPHRVACLRGCMCAWRRCATG